MPDASTPARLWTLLRALISARLLWRIAFIIYAFVLLGLTLWPNLNVPGPVPRTDLYAHFAAFGLFTVLLTLTRWLGPIGSLEALLLTFIFASGFAVIDEAAQSHPYFRRQSVPDDLAANMGGIALGLIATVALRFLAPLHARKRHITDENNRTDFITHARTFLLLTLTSRVFGLARDAVFAAVFGASAIASAFFTAFLIPNIFRRLFGEGALTAAFLPRYTQLREDDPVAADRFASLTVIVALCALCALAALGELGLFLALRTIDTPGPIGGTGNAAGVVTMTMIMLPFMPLVCGTAVLGAMLQTQGRFAPTAAAPIILNICMISALAASAWIFGLGHPRNLPRVAAWLAVGVTGAGALQLLWCFLELRGRVRWTTDLRPAISELTGLGKRMLPVILGLGAAQLGLLIDAVIAGWPVLIGPTIAGHPYPLDTGSASILYYAQRLYQLPLGVFAIAIATAVFPELSRHTKDPLRFGDTLRRSLRTTLFIGIPAAIGLILVRYELVRTIYGGAPGRYVTTGKAFMEADAQRVARTLFAYAPAVVAIGATHVFTRAFYAQGYMRTPMFVGIATITGNIVLSLILMWPLREQGVALASAIFALLQVVALAILLRKHAAAQGWHLTDAGLLRSLGLSVGLALLMAPAAIGAMVLIRPHVSDTRPGHALILAGGVIAGGTLYAALSRLLRRPELGWLLARKTAP